MSNNQNKDLLICKTPFQVCLGLKVLEKVSSKNKEGLFFILNKNKKYDFYASKLNENVEKSFSIRVLNSYFYLFTILWTLFKMKGKKYEKVYLASIDCFLVQLVLSHIRFKELYTFDDGTANIFKDSAYYKVISRNFKLKILDFIFKNKYDINRIKEESINHFTIYNDLPNIVTNTININKSKIHYNDYTNLKSVNFFLGQPYYEFDKRINNVIINKILNDFNIYYYYPHPREKKGTLYQDVEIVNSNLIFEDFIVNYLSDNPNISVVLYTFCSGSALNLISLPRVKVIYLYDTVLKEKYNNLYQIFFNYCQTREIEF